uniref:Uncharacterized protein n=1 Tax=Anguilla anguilla TaxID=7936 RepID=A0A0E9V3J4_ANGAN
MCTLSTFELFDYKSKNCPVQSKIKGKCICPKHYGAHCISPSAIYCKYPVKKS